MAASTQGGESIDKSVPREHNREAILWQRMWLCNRAFRSVNCVGIL